MIAYKATKIQDFFVYTTLIISCKKSEKNAWALLARPLEKNDPNINWHPIHVWTNDKALNYEVSAMDFGKNYYSKQVKKPLNALIDPAVDIFAFQEMEKTSGRVQNDKPIFDSITSLMKAQAYELRVLPKRKTDLAIYHFSLISVVDTEIIQLLFSREEIEATEIDSTQFLANYIINKEQDVSKIRFIRSSSFEKSIIDYDKLHTFNCEVFSDYYESFYRNSLKDWKRTKVLIDNFRNKLWWPLFQAVSSQIESKFHKKSINLSWDKVNNRVEIQVVLSDDEIQFMNNDTKVQEIAKKALEDIYKYKGSFIFTSVLPF